jgi:hypothetical protein
MSTSHSHADPTSAADCAKQLGVVEPWQLPQSVAVNLELEGVNFKAVPLADLNLDFGLQFAPEPPDFV